MFFLARIKSRNETILDGTTVLSGLTAGAGAGDGGAAKRVAPKKKPKKERAAKVPKATPKKESDASRNASEVCKNFSLGKCKDPCPFGRIHQGGAAPDGAKGAHAKKRQ